VPDRHPGSPLLDVGPQEQHRLALCGARGSTTRARGLLPPMLSIGRLGSGSADYYLSSVATGAEDYFLRQGEEPGRWLGGSAGALGLGGLVGADDLRAVLDGRDPVDGTQLVRGPGGARARTAGFDLTFKAPKSVSLLEALGDPRLRAEVSAAHAGAVEAALAYLEDHAAFLRRGRGGHELVPAAGLVAAGFTHRTSRAGDPALHTHVLVANIAQDHEGRLGAIDGRAIYRHAKTAGYLYQTELRQRLTRSLGVEFQEPHNGAADIRGVPRDVIRAFSRRRREIEARMTERGETSARTAEMGGPRYPQGQGLRRLGRAPRGRVDGEGGRARLRSQRDRGLPRQGERTSARSRRGRARLRRARRAGWVDRQRVELQPPRGRPDARRALRRGGGLRARRAGRSLPRLPGGRPSLPERDTHETRYSTHELIATEQELLAGARERRGEGAGLVRDSVLASVLDRRPELSSEQAAMVRGLVSSGDGLQVVLGWAASGKTYALEPARMAWEADGYQVIGAALAARAAAALEDGSGIRSQTLARLLTDARHPERSPLYAMSVVVLDEAGMAGTRNLAELARHAEEAGAKLVLVGDPAQLPEIAAGGAFRALAEELGALELHENRRQELRWERQALLDIREGRAQEAVAAYLAHRRIHVGADPDAAKDRLVADWWQATAEGADSLMIAATRSDAEDLARRARARRVAAGEIGVQSMQLPCGEVAVGDRVMALRNDRLLGVQNGMRGVVVGLQGRGLEVAVDGERRGCFRGGTWPTAT
jgi:conjugative relaxase-like TrwC/TraI family protein